MPQFWSEDAWEKIASKADRIAMEEGGLEAYFATLTDEQRQWIQYDWDFWGRPSQQEPEGDWRTWLILAGRGWGKTRTGAEWINDKVAKGTYRRIHLVGATAADIRDIMVEGPSGILACSPPWMKATYRPTKRRIEWPNGAWALCFSADEPERLRGEQCEAAWADEMAAWRYDEAWVQLMLGLRLGVEPRVVVTTTPRPTARIRKLMQAESTAFTTGSTYENTQNLAAAFAEEVVAEYEGSRFGRQELYAQILDDSPGSLWKRDLLDRSRLGPGEEPDHYDRIAVAVDPAISFSETSSETGIVSVARRGNRGYVLGDHSGRMKPDEWARKVVAVYRELRADVIVAEKNQGGEMVRHTISVYDPGANIKLVSATRNKETRAEPVSGLYEQDRIRHCGFFPELEDQMCVWEPGSPSPDRMDALVWGLTELLVGSHVTKILKLSREPVLQGKSYWKRYG